MTRNISAERILMRGKSLRISWILRLCIEWSVGGAIASVVLVALWVSGCLVWGGGCDWRLLLLLPIGALGGAVVMLALGRPGVLDTVRLIEKRGGMKQQLLTAMELALQGCSDSAAIWLYANAEREMSALSVNLWTRSRRFYGAGLLACVLCVVLLALASQPVTASVGGEQADANVRAKLVQLLKTAGNADVANAVELLAAAHVVEVADEETLRDILGKLAIAGGRITDISRAKLVLSAVRSPNAPASGRDSGYAGVSSREGSLLPSAAGEVVYVWDPAYAAKARGESESVSFSQTQPHRATRADAWSAAAARAIAGSRGKQVPAEYRTIVREYFSHR